MEVLVMNLRARVVYCVNVSDSSVAGSPDCQQSKQELTNKKYYSTKGLDFVACLAVKFGHRTDAITCIWHIGRLHRRLRQQHQSTDLQPNSLTELDRSDTR